MTSWLNQTEFVRRLADNIIAPKKLHYHEDFLKNKVIENTHLRLKNLLIENRFGERLKASIFTSQDHYENEDQKCCVIYLHGYGSHRIQGATILSYLPSNFGLCCFDFSGSGKSEGNISTYGVKEQLDINAVVEELKANHGFSKFVLWGRSMGAVASLLYTSKIAQKNQTNHILFQVLDSPFNSFEEIAKTHAKNNLMLPGILIQFGLNIIKQKLSKEKFNPFLINLEESVKNCETPSLFVYCENDKIISAAENSKKIINNFNPKGIYERLIIEEDHNSFRSNETLVKIFHIMSRYIKPEKKQKTKHLKGIAEIFSIQYSTPSNKSKTEKSEEIKKLAGGLKGNFSTNKQIRRLIGKAQSIIPREIGVENEEEMTQQTGRIFCFKSCSKPVSE